MALYAQHTISVVFPAYNEAENIERTVQQAVHFLETVFSDWEVIVVDDGSRDGMGEIADRLARQDQRLKIVHHPVNKGYGAALKSGIQAASKNLIFFCDSDLQFHMNELMLLLMWIEQYDVVIGYRSERRDALYRKLNAFGWKMLVRLLLGLKVKDIDCAFKLFRSEVFRAIKIDAVGAMVNTDILVQTVRLGFKIKEVPVTHFPRRYGRQTGANFRVVLKAFRELLRLYHKLKSVKPIVFRYDPRSGPASIALHDKRISERRRVMLPINFPDRRHRFIRYPDSESASASEHTDHHPYGKSNLTVEKGRRRLKIAMVAASPFPANHGTPAGIREMAQAIAANDHHVHVVTYHFGEGAPPENVMIHRIPNLGFKREIVVGPSFEKPILDLLLVFQLIRVILREKIDLIHGHNYEGAIVGYLAGLVTGRPLIYNAVNTMIDELPSYNFFKPRVVAVWLAKLLDCWVPRSADAVLALSEDLAGFLTGQGLKKDRVHVIPLGVDCAHFEGRDGCAIREKYHVGRSPLVMYTGILDRFQRIDYLIRALTIVVNRQPEVRLLIVSNIAKEQDLEDCRRLIREEQLDDHVRIATGIPFEEIPTFLSAADVTVVSRPNTPGLPVKLLNYMAANRPVVVFEGSAKGLKHMKNAIVVKDHDWEALGQGIITLLDDPVLAKTLARNARKWLGKNLSWPVLVEKIERVYYGVLEKKVVP